MDVGRYSKPRPSLMPDVDSTLRQITQWKHIITTELMSAFYQIPLALHFVGSGCMPVQRWACLAQKLPWRNSCVLPCEIEALSIAAAKHFSPYIIQLKTPACILTDSKPCVQSFELLGLPSRQSVQTYGTLMPILLKAMPFQEVDRH